MTNYSDFDSPPPPPPRAALPIPMSQPVVTYILLAAIVIVWGITELAGESIENIVLVTFANYGPAILEGQTWRLLTSMFLHADWRHLFFNAFGLFIFGMEMERLYGPSRYTVIYFLAGLFGSLASFASRGPEVLSVGASGAIFGIIGMNLAFFLLHRDTFGEFGRSRITSTLFIIGVNIFFGLTVPRIDNMAHMGGLIAGFALGYALAPRYQLSGEYTTAPRVVDTVSLLNRWWAPALAVIVLAGGVWLTMAFWLSRF